jgi:hypothetical protein
MEILITWYGTVADLLFHFFCHLHNPQSIPSSMRTQLKEKQAKLRDLLQLNPTIDNPLDELAYSHWMHRITNICLDAAQMALMAVDTSPGMNYLFAPSTTSDNTVRTWVLASS